MEFGREERKSQQASLLHSVLLVMPPSPIFPSVLGLIGNNCLLLLISLT